MNNSLKLLLLTAYLTTPSMQYAMNDENECLLGDLIPEVVNEEEYFLLRIYNSKIARYFKTFVTYGADDNAWERAQYANEYIFNNYRDSRGQPEITPLGKFKQTQKDPEFISLCQTIKEMKISKKYRFEITIKAKSGWQITVRPPQNHRDIEEKLKASKYVSRVFAGKEHIDELEQTLKTKEEKNGSHCCIVL